MVEDRDRRVLIACEGRVPLEMTRVDVVWSGIEAMAERLGEGTAGRRVSWTLERLE